MLTAICSVPDTMDPTPARLIPVENEARPGVPIIYSAPQLERLAREVADFHNIGYETLVSASRRHTACHPRQDFMYRARQIRRADGQRRYSYPAIARWLAARRGGDTKMDHTTVIYGVRSEAKRRREALIQQVRNDNAVSAFIHGAIS